MKNKQGTKAELIKVIVFSIIILNVIAFSFISKRQKVEIRPSDCAAPKEKEVYLDDIADTPTAFVTDEKLSYNGFVDTSFYTEFNYPLDGITDLRWGINDFLEEHGIYNSELEVLKDSFSESQGIMTYHVHVLDSDTNIKVTLYLYDIKHEYQFIN